MTGAARPPLLAPSIPAGGQPSEGARCPLRRLPLATLLIALAAPAPAAQFDFCWLGANGYTMTGTIAFPDPLMNAPLVTEDDVTAFRITGYRDGIVIGAWSMEDRGPDTTWHLRFRPADLTFLTGGSFRGPESQGWNADGGVTDCGDPGFGFNSGNYSQDVCVNGIWVEESGVPPPTPFRASRGPVTPDCRGPDLISGAGSPPAAPEAGRQAG